MTQQFTSERSAVGAMPGWCYAEALLVSGSRECSGLTGQQLRAARETSLRLGAEPLAAAVHRLARRAGVRLRTAEPIPTPQGPLVVRELAVLEQVALRGANRQVGEQLLIGDKTGSIHLSRLRALPRCRKRHRGSAVAYERSVLVNGAGSGGAV